MPDKTKPQNYPKPGNVDVADRWSESKRSYLGRSGRYAMDMKLEIATRPVMVG